MNTIKELLAKSEISQYRLAKELGISSQAVSQWCLGQTKPSPLAQMALKKYFGVEVTS